MQVFKCSKNNKNHPKAVDLGIWCDPYSLSFFFYFWPEISLLSYEKIKKKHPAHQTMNKQIFYLDLFGPGFPESTDLPCVCCPSLTCPASKHADPCGQVYRRRGPPDHTRTLSRVWLCDSMNCSLLASSVCGILGQEDWSGLPFPPPGDLPDPGMKPTFLMSHALAGGCFTTNATWEALWNHRAISKAGSCSGHSWLQKQTHTQARQLCTQLQGHTCVGMWSLLRGGPAWPVLMYQEWS